MTWIPSCRQRLSGGHSHRSSPEPTRPEGPAPGSRSSKEVASMPWIPVLAMKDRINDPIVQCVQARVCRGRIELLVGKLRQEMKRKTIPHFAPARLLIELAHLP